MSNKISVYFPTFNSFIISLAIYVALVGFIVYKAGDAIQAAKRYTDTKDAFMDVMIVTPERADTIMAPKAEQVTPEPIEPQPLKPEPKIAEEEKQITTNKAVDTPSEPEVTPEPPKPEPVPEPEPVDMKSLFDDVKVKDVPKPKPKKATQSNKKSAKENASAQKRLSQALNALQASDEVRAPAEGLTGTFDEFRGGITRIIETRWQRYKADTNDEINVKITIDENGRLIGYSFVTRSYDAQFQSKARDLLEALKSVSFPKPPNGQKTTLPLLLSDKISIQPE